MKVKEIKIRGCSSDLSPDDKPAVGLFGVEGTGKTRFAATAPDPIGLVALDKKSKRTFQAMARELGKYVVANEHPLLSDKEAMQIALIDGEKPEGLKKIKETYLAAHARVSELAMEFAAHPDIRTVVVDTTSQLWDWILFAHFGRRNKIPPVSRAAPNQDMIDFVNGLRSKNLVLIHRAKEIWKNTGRVDKNSGEPIKEPSGKFEQDGFKNIGGFLTMNCEMINSNRLKVEKDEEEEDFLGRKFNIRVLACQTNALLEGRTLDDFGLSGAGISWDNLMAVAGIGGGEE
jgi:hypothetical protein